MNREERRRRLEADLQADEGEMEGFFLALVRPALWKLITSGPNAWFSLETYHFAVTSRGVVFQKLTAMGDFGPREFFRYDEVSSVEMSTGGLLHRRIRFDFVNGTTLTVKAPIKGVQKVAKLTPALQMVLEERIGSAP